jgi:SAM-dependent methyltransferase
VRPLVIDLAPTVRQARESLGAHALRIDWREGDLTEVDLGGDYELVLVNNVLHMNPPAVARRIVERAAGALAPGGRLVIKELRIDHDRTGSPSGLLLALAGELIGAEFYLDDVAALIASVRSAGLIEIETRTLASAPDAIVVIGRRP